ncbi:zinc finger-containing ubiquitin peptidase 1 isoform X1 [Leptonychotes weddellii]|uniref:Zinc finger-containing ubiquitin peptidase 1 isoform X1 n=1 Tax=Leptonychotes weddellii TaxID=9713 RepID=A0A7F8QY18_LEPWE|nr:zinc finger-containing ubiquitin peptidase 1 isoform X1 [Leptonychotes weddellii]
MLSCDICGETVTSEPDMKAHLLIVHMENEVICPFCKLSGVNYDEMCFHIETAHFEQNELERSFERINTIPIRTSDNRKDTLQCRMEVNSSVHSACASNHPKISAQSLPNDGTLKHKAFYSENLTESRKFLKSKEKECDPSKIKRSIYETTYSPPECPFCGRIEDCSQDMENHVKTKHADLLDTPSEASAPGLSSENGPVVRQRSIWIPPEVCSLIGCCRMRHIFWDPCQLPASHQDHDQPLYDCPMCGLICTNYHILQEHVDLHLEESNFGQVALIIVVP